MAPDDISEIVDQVYRSEWGRIVATLIRQVGDFDLAEEVAQEAFADRAGVVAVDGRAGVPAGLDRPDGAQSSDRSLPPPRPGCSESSKRWPRTRSPLAGILEPDEGDGARDPGRSPAPDLHLLPPGAAAGRAGGPHPADALRSRDGRDRPRLPRLPCHDGSAPRAREAQDQRAPVFPIPSPTSAIARADRRRPDRHLSRLHRRLCRDTRRTVRHDSVRRSDPAWPSRAGPDDAASRRK